MINPFFAWRLCALVVLFAVLSACGGGGGGGSGSSNPPPTNPPPKLVTLQARGIPYLFFPVSQFYERLLELSALAVTSLDLATQAPDLMKTISCDSDGSFIMQLIDRDGNQAVSSGDIVNFTYSGCYLRVAGGTITGTLSLAITEFNSSTLTAVATINANELHEFQAGLSGNYTINYQSNTSGDSLGITIGSDELTIQLPDELYGTDRFKDVNIFKTVDSHAGTYSISGGFTIVSSGGQLPCRTNTPLMSVVFNYPTSGQIECNGAAGSAVRINSTSAGTARYFWNAGDGVFQDQGANGYGSVFDGFLMSPVLRTQPAGAGANTNVSTNFEITDFSSVQQTGAVYAVTPSTGSVDPQHLVQIDPLTGFILRSLALLGEPRGLATTTSGNLIYVGYLNLSIIDVIDATSWSKVSQIDIGDTSLAGAPFPVPYNTNKILVSPIDDHYIVVVVGTDNSINGAGVYAYKNGGRLGNGPPVLNGLSADAEIGISPLGQILFTEGASAVNISSNGLSDAIRLDPSGNSLSGGIALDNENLYAGDGTVYNLETKTITNPFAANKPCFYACLNVTYDPYMDLIIIDGSTIFNAKSKAFAISGKMTNISWLNAKSVNENQFVSGQAGGGGGKLYFSGKDDLLTFKPTAPMAINFECDTPPYIFNCRPRSPSDH